jgi:hypothetical protein
MEELLKFNRLEAVLKEYGQAVEDLYRDKLTKDDKRASGALIDKLRFIYHHGHNKYVVSLKLQDYWYYVEHGRKPGKFPPPDAILRWIEIKPVLPYPDKNGKLPTNKQLAYLIGRKIATKGIDPGNQLADTLEEINNQYIQKITDALSEDLDDSVGLIIKHIA